MTLRRPNKSVYKVYIKSKDKYYAGSGSKKSTWASLTWALSAADDAQRYYRLTINDIEIHEFPVSDAIKHSYPDLLKSEQDARKEKEERRRMTELKKEELKQIKRAKEILAQSKEQIKNATEFLKSKGFDVNIDNIDSIN